MTVRSSYQLTSCGKDPASAADKTIVEVVAYPELHETDMTITLCAGSATLTVTSDHRIPTLSANGEQADVEAAGLKPGDVVFVDGVPSELDTVLAEKLDYKEQVVKLAFKPDLPVGVFARPSMISSKGDKKKALRRSMKNRRQGGLPDYETIGEYQD